MSRVWDASFPAVAGASHSLHKGRGQWNSSSCPAKLMRENPQVPDGTHIELQQHTLI